MTTVSERAREAQEAEFKARPGNDALKEPTFALYSAVDGLSPDLRALMVETALRRIIPGISEMVSTESVHERLALAKGLGIYAGIAGYATALNREAREDYSTGDVRVDDIFAMCGALLKATVSTAVPEEIRGAVDAMLKAVQDRVDAGEDLDVVFDDEYAKAKDAFGDYVIERDGDVVHGEKKKPADDRPTPGLYL